MRYATLFIFVAVLAWSGPATAQQEVHSEDATSDDSPRTASPSAPGRWYGWQILLADAASTALTLTVPTVGLPVMTVAPAVIHAANGESGNALASVGVRFGAPVSGALVGAAIAAGACHDPWRETDSMPCTFGVAGIGALAGLVSASVIDVALIARTRPHAPRVEPSNDDSEPSTPTSVGLTVRPTVVVTHASAALGLSASF